MDWLRDERTNCWSVLTTISVREYLALVRDAHADRGGLAGQRDTLKTTTAKRIRDRMSSDIRQGAVLPPVVIGALADPKAFDNFPITDASSLNDFLPQDGGEIAIIDGMQRTASLMEASSIDPLVLDKHVRVEFWLAQSVTSMIYRMLVLNTGQVPWTLARQLAIICWSPLLAEIRKNVGNLDRIFSPDKPGRRVGPAQFGSDALVELYMAFSLRKTTVDTKEALSEEFSLGEISLKILFGSFVPKSVLYKS